MDLEYHWLITAGLIASSLIAISSNLLLLLVFCRRRGLRTVSNRFVINLLFINLLSGLLLVPFLVVDREAGKRPDNLNISTSELLEKFTSTQPESSAQIIYEKETTQLINGTLFESKQLLIENRTDLELIQTDITYSFRGDVGFCEVSQFCMNFICTASILSIFLIGGDQYFAVIHPLRCHSYVNKTKAVVFIVMSWGLSGLCAVLTASTDANAYYFPNVCANVTHGERSLFFTVIYFAMIICTPFILICLIYVAIYRAAHRNSARIRKRTNHRDILVKVHSAPTFADFHEELQEFSRLKPPNIKRTHSERANIITSIRSKFSNANVFRYREENRTAKISILVIVMVLVCYIPYGAVFVMNSVRMQQNEFLNTASLFLLISSNLLSPVLFAYRNRRVQRELKKFLSSYFMKDDLEKEKPKIVINHIETELSKSADGVEVVQPFLQNEDVMGAEKKSILKRVCSTNWSSYKKCSFINVPDGCLDARGSFSSASTQISTED